LLKEGIFSLTSNTQIISEYYKDLIGEYIQSSTGLKLDSTNNGNEIIVGISQQNRSFPEEGYELKIDNNRITISAGTEKGLFYGVQSLRQLLYNYGNELPCCQIEDYPRFSYRGFMLDVGRHFFNKEVIFKLLDLCAIQKLNVFHFHLTEDQGWRIEIEKYPLLTKVGSYRKETVIRGKSDKTPVSGYYTKSDIREIVSHARMLNITVIPEIDIPGHIRSAIAAYPYLSCEEKQLEVGNKFGISDHIACAGKESTYCFFEDVLDEVCEMFNTNLIHLGGDEVPKKRWKSCPHCQAKMKREGLTGEENLQGYFLNRMHSYLRDKNIGVVSWNDALKSSNLNSDIIIQHWLDGRNAKNVIKEINKGRKTIISDFYHYYLDYPYGMTSLKKTYNFNPVMKGIDEDKTDNIIGLEASLWTESVKDEKTIHFMTFPRLTAVAERSWSRWKKSDYQDFLNRLESFIVMIGKLGVSSASVKDANVKGLKSLKQTIQFTWRQIYQSFDSI